MTQFKCSITHEIMTDPVTAMDGFNYERSAILEWFKNNDTSPNTREKIGKTLITNHTIRSELSAAGHPVVTLNRTINKKKNVRITLVLDVSGSMATSVESKNTNEPSFSRLDLIKHAICSIGAMMQENDQLCVITFSDSARAIMPWTKMNEHGKSVVQELAKYLRSGGGTDISAGIEMGVAQGGDHTILLTDGANTSVNRVINTVSNTLANYIVGKVASYGGKIHSVGLGMAEDLDTPTLRAISASKDGLYCFCPDASMVGTVFIHLMANICIGETGVPFEEHDQFMKVINDVAITRDMATINDTSYFSDPILNEELISKDENKGQVGKSIINWSTWGRHYLPAFIDAHIHCVTTNFKDASLQGYATPNVRAFIEASEVIFLGITPPIPSCNNNYRIGYSPSQFTSVTMNSQGICFGPDTKINVMGLDDKMDVDFVSIKDIRRGMRVRTVSQFGPQTTAVRCLVISPATEMINVAGFWVSKKHPLMKKFPSGLVEYVHAESFLENAENAENAEIPVEVQYHKCYNLVLENGHVIEINGVQAVTLGHGFLGGIVQHNYLGTHRIVDDLSEAPGWEYGLVEIKGLERDEHGVCGIIV